MQILHEAARPYDINSINEVMSVSHFWTFSGSMLDFKLEPLEYLEETTGQTLTIEIMGKQLDIPASWNLIAVERESYTIDTIPVTTCATFEHDILLFSPADTKLVTGKVRVIDYKESASCIHPMVPKRSAMVSPVIQAPWHGQMVHYGIVATPFDLHRYIGGRAVGEILG